MDTVGPMKKIEAIFTHGKGALGIDEDGRLYWNDEAVVTEQKMTLQWWVNVAIIVTGFSTLLFAIITLLRFICYES